MRAVALLLAALVISLVISGCGGGTPQVHAGTPLDDAYATLHKDGFQVSVQVPTRFGLGTGYPNPAVVSSVKQAGDVATIFAEFPMPLGSPVGFRHPARVRVPNFVGGSAEAAIAWAGAHGVPWWMKLPNLPPSNAPQLYLAYRVVAQNHGRGSTITQNDYVRLTIEPR
jgi:hypothetical protein